MGKNKNLKNGAAPSLKDRKDIIYKIENFIKACSSLKNGAKALGFSSRELYNIVNNNGITPRNQKILNRVGLTQESISKENIETTNTKIEHATKLKEEIYEKLLLQSNINSIGLVYNWMNIILDSINEKFSFKNHLNFLKDYYPQLIHSYWNEQELILKTNFCKEEKDYHVFVKFPEWVRLGILEAPEIEIYMNFNFEPGSDAWMDEDKYDLIDQIMEYLEDMKLTFPQSKDNIFNKLSIDLINDLIERLNYEDKMDWGTFTRFSYTQAPILN